MKVHESVIMLDLRIFFIVLSCNTILLNSSIRIGKLSNQIYTPSPSNINLPISFYYTNSCQECLCYGMRSTIATFVAVNCLRNIRLCLLYSNYTTNYSIQSNSTNDLYFFTLPPLMNTTVLSQTTMDTTSTMAITSTPILTSTAIATTTSVITSTMATSISPTTSFVTSWNTSGITVAGVTGEPGVTANKFNHPYCLVLDSLKTLYVTDQPNQRVQKWVVNASTGVTVAGQSNASTGITLKYLSYPSDLALDIHGNLFIVDGGNHRVVHWTMNASSATLVAGNGSAGSGNNQLSSPIGLAIDINSSTIYISDAGNHRIMRYLANATSGTVVAGGYGPGMNSSQLNNPRGVYFDSAANSLIIANNAAHNIVRWVLGSSSWILLAGSSTGLYGATPTLLYNPSDVTLDPTGNMYVSDEGNNRIQLFLAGQSSGQTIIGVTGTPGNTSQLLNTPSSLALDNQLNIYVVDYSNYRVQKFLHH